MQAYRQGCKNTESSHTLLAGGQNAAVTMPVSYKVCFRKCLIKIQRYFMKHLSKLNIPLIK